MREDLLRYLEAAREHCDGLIVCVTRDELWGEYERRFADADVKIVYLPYTADTFSTMLRSALQRLSVPP